MARGQTLDTARKALAAADEPPGTKRPAQAAERGLSPTIGKRAIRSGKRPSVFEQRTGSMPLRSPVAGITGRLGRIANVTRQDTAGLSSEVPLDLTAIQEAWPAFESGFDSLHGRRMIGLIDNRAGRYRLCTERLPAISRTR